MIPPATRNLKWVDDVLRQVAFLSCPNIPYYPKHKLLPNHHNMVYNLQLNFDKCRVFGSLRAGAKIFPYPVEGCPACCDAYRNTAHILRKCTSITMCLNTWFMHSEPLEGRIRMALSEQAFAESIFDLSSFSTKASRRATVSFVWEATQAATRAAIRRRDAG